jgi:hypothetical protein
VSLAGFVMAFAILLALGVTAFVLYTIVNRTINPVTTTTANAYSGVSGTTATLQTSTTGDSSTGSTNSGGLGGTILVRPHAATASSSQKPTSITDFRPTNLLDGDVTSAWVTEGEGTADWVQFDFDEAIPLVRIDVANGYQKDEEHFSADERVKDIQVQYSDGTVQFVVLLDAEGLQTIQPSVDQTEWIKLTILSVYPTSKFQNAALSEVRIYETLQ